MLQKPPDGSATPGSCTCRALCLLPRARRGTGGAGMGLKGPPVPQFPLFPPGCTRILVQSCARWGLAVQKHIAGTGHTKAWWLHGPGEVLVGQLCSGGVLLGESFWPLFILGQGGGAVPRCEHPLPASWAPLRARNGAVARGLGQLTASPGSAAPALTPPCSSSLCPGSGFLAAT